MCIRFAGVPEAAASSAAIFCVFAIVMGLTVVPLIPGNVGVSELAYVGLLTPIAGTAYANEVTAGVLVFRMLTWLLLIPTGFIALAIWRRGLRSAARSLRRTRTDSDSGVSSLVVRPRWRPRCRDRGR